jgi:putative nucleotidyltransferase with HDIG domain
LAVDLDFGLPRRLAPHRAAPRRRAGPDIPPRSDIVITHAASSKDQFIQPSQLCVGLFVYLDVPWADHPFTFSSFKIKSLDQIELIQGLGLERIRYAPGKSDAKPLAVQAVAKAAPAPAPDAAGAEAPAADAAAPEPPAADAAAEGEAHRAKRERLERVAAHHEKVAVCERELLSHARTFKSINQNLFALPEQASADAVRLVDSMVDSVLVQTELAIHLMAEHVGGDDVYHHALNVSVLAMMLAKEMKAPPPAVRLIGLGALLHDIGKSELPERIVRKLTPLTRTEQEQMQQHCANGVTIGQRMMLPPEALLIIAQHHEHVDGSGYPRRLHGAQLSLLAKIVSVANVYENLCNPVNPTFALTPHEALSTLWGQRREHFDTTAMQTFVRCMGVYPPGTVVVLSNGTIGVVVAVNTTRALKPTVLIYDPAFPKEAAMVVDLEQEPEVTVAKTLQPKQLPPPIYDYLSPRKRVCYYFHGAGERGGK